MRVPVRLPGIVAKVIAVSALILGSVGIAAVPAHAASMSLSGPSSGIPGSVATYTVTGGSA